jgi:hypothetical protein
MIRRKRGNGTLDSFFPGIFRSRHCLPFNSSVVRSLGNANAPARSTHCRPLDVVARCPALIEAPRYRCQNDVQLSINPNNFLSVHVDDCWLLIDRCSTGVCGRTVRSDDLTSILVAATLTMRRPDRVSGSSVSRCQFARAFTAGVFSRRILVWLAFRSLPGQKTPNGSSSTSSARCVRPVARGQESPSMPLARRHSSLLKLIVKA